MSIKKLGIQNQNVAGKRVKKVKPIIGATYKEFDKFQREVEILKINLKYQPKILKNI